MEKEALGRIKQTAQSFAEKVNKIYGTEILDYSEVSIQAFDQIMSKWESENPETVSGQAGCYLGKVIIRNLGGSWCKREELIDGRALSRFYVVVEAKIKNEDLSLFESAEQYFSPFQIAYEKLTKGASVFEFYQGLKEKWGK